MTESVTVALSPDEDGYLGRECPACELYFKVRPGTGITEQEIAYCPYCGDQSGPSDFTTRDQLNYATSIALGEFQKGILGGLKLTEIHTKGPISLHVTMTVEGDEIPVEHYQERNLETSITCDACTLDYKIYGVFATCPDCGNHNSGQILKTNLGLLRQQLTTADEQTTEDILKNAVSTFDAFGRATTEHNDGIKISFQNLDQAEQQLQARGHSLRAHMTREEWEFITTAFQKRHALVHNLGVIDDAYLQRATDPDAIVGRKIRLSKAEVERTIDLLDRIAGTITRDAPPPLPAPKERKIGNPYQLGSDALRLAILLFSRDTDGLKHGRMSENDAQKELGIDDLPFEAAVDELTERHLVEKEHRWLASTQYMPVALRDTLDYSPSNDDRIVARTLIDAAEQLANHEIEVRAGITTQRLNHAIRRLDDKRAIAVVKAIGTAPYSFYSARATGATLRYLEKVE